MAPTLAKFLPELRDERYMSRKPCLSCWRRGRSVSGTAALGDVREGSVAAEDESVETGADATMGVGMVGLTAADAVAVVDVVAAVLGTALTGRGCDIGVS